MPGGIVNAGSGDMPRAPGTGAPSWEAERVARAAAEDEVARLARLQRVTAALSGARTPDQVAEVTLGEGLAALGGSRGIVLVAHDGGAPVVLRSAGVADAEARLAAELAGAHPAGAELRRGEATFAEFTGDAAARWPLPGPPPGTIAALPLVARGRWLGALVVAHEAPRPYGEGERAYAIALAAVCAQALDRAGLYVAEKVARAEAVAAQRRLAFLDGLSAHLAGSLEAAGLARGVAGLRRPGARRLRGPLRRGRGGARARRERGAGPARRGGGGAPRGEWRARARRRGGGGRRHRARRRGGRAARRGGRAARGGRPFARRAALRDAGGGRSPWPGGPRARGRRGAPDRPRARARAPARRGERGGAGAGGVPRGRLARAARSIGTLRFAVQLLLRDDRSGATRSPESRLRIVERQSDRLVRLGDALLDVSRITSGRLELSLVEIEFAALARDAAAGVADEAAEAGSPITCDAADAVLARADPARLEQVLANLLSNAVKYGAGKPVRLAVRAHGGRAHIEVEDRGIGIAAADQARVFGRFERAVSGRNYSASGWGSGSRATSWRRIAARSG